MLLYHKDKLLYLNTELQAFKSKFFFGLRWEKRWKHAQRHAWVCVCTYNWHTFFSWMEEFIKKFWVLMLQWLWTEHTFIITTWKWSHYLQRIATDPSIHINWSISLIFKIIFIALLKYNLLNMQSVHWKCTIHRFLTASRVRQLSLQVISKVLHHSKLVLLKWFFFHFCSWFLLVTG